MVWCSRPDLSPRLYFTCLMCVIRNASNGSMRRCRLQMPSPLNCDPCVPWLVLPSTVGPQRPCQSLIAKPMCPPPALFQMRMSPRLTW